MIPFTALTFGLFFAFVSLCLMALLILAMRNER